MIREIMMISLLCNGTMCSWARHKCHVYLVCCPELVSLVFKAAACDKTVAVYINQVIYIDAVMVLIGVKHMHLPALSEQNSGM